MNRIYRLVWSKSRKCIVAVSEIAKGNTKGGSKASTVGSVLTSTLLALGGIAGLTDMTIENAHATAQTVTTSITGPVTLNNGDSLQVSASGTISGGTSGVLATSVTTSFINNAGTISGINNGIYLRQSTLSGGITNSGSISGNEFGIYLRQSTLSGGITNSGSISSGGSAGIYLSSSTLSGGIINSGSISGNNAGIYLNQSTLSGGITNSGSISSGTFDGIYLSSSTLSDGITNSGSISGGTAGIYLGSSSLSGGITNSGLISGGTSTGNAGIYIDPTSSVDSIINTGAITGAFGINNLGHIGTLSNGQGGNSSSASTTALTYTGTLPTNYNIIINSATHYGQLAVTSPTGSTTFGISALSGVGTGVLGSYLHVLTGLTNTNLGLSGSSITSTSNGYGICLLGRPCT